MTHSDLPVIDIDEIQRTYALKTPQTK